MLKGFTELAEDVLDLPVRIGISSGILEKRIHVSLCRDLSCHYCWFSVVQSDAGDGRIFMRFRLGLEEARLEIENVYLELSEGP
jgi:hypothetical protein